MSDFIINATGRADQGKGASRRLRRTGYIPAIVYGGGEEPAAISLEHREIAKHLEDEAFYSHILKLKLDGAEERVLLRDLQRHPAKAVVLHVDLLRVKAGEAIRMNVPLHFLNTDIAVGVKTGGGVINHLMSDVEISCLPKDLPEYIEIDVEALELGESLHLSDLTLPEGVELTAFSHGGDDSEHDLAIIVINKPKVIVDEDEDTGEAAASEGEGDAPAEGGE